MEDNYLKYPRGSEWAKWDLHVHTPASIFHNYTGRGGDIWETFITDLEALPPEFKVLGINDYLFIDGYNRLIKEQQNGRLKNIELLLPVIEFRLKKFAGSDSKLRKVNFHVLFSPDINPDIIQQHFLNAISRHYYLTPAYSNLKEEWHALATRESLEDLGKRIKNTVPPEKLKDYGSDLEEGFYNLNFDEDDILEVLKGSHYFKGKYLTAIGKTEWADIKWNDNSIADKIDVINKVSFVFISSHTINEYKNSKKQLKDSKVNDLLLDCSDAHCLSSCDEKDRVGKCFTWIKSNPTFEGLKQILIEPVDRTFVGAKPPKLAEAETNKSKYIDSIKIRPTVTGSSNSWFDDEIPLNSGLVAVIGRKGSGKSGFTDIVSLCGSSKIIPEDYSFLTKDKFRKRGLAKNYEASLRWQGSEYNAPVNLMQEVHIGTDVEKVKYLPQKYVETICNENGVSTLFQKEIDKVIFEYVPYESRIETSTLEELIQIKTEAIDERIDTLRNNLSTVNTKIVKLENCKKQEHSDALNKKLDEKKLELSLLAAPKEVNKPKTALSQEQQVKFDQITHKLEEVEENITTTKKLCSEINSKITKLGRIKSVISQLQNKKEELIAKIQPDADSLTINPSEIIQLTINDEVLTQKENEFIAIKKDIEAKLEEDSPDSHVSLYTKKANLIREKEEIMKAFTAEQKAYDDYLEEVKKYNAKKKAIEGHEDDTTLETIISLKKEITYLSNGLNKDLDTAKTERIILSIELYEELAKKIEFYRDIYRPLSKFIEEEKSIQEKSGSVLSFDVGITFSKNTFTDNFFSFIHRQRDGSFQHKESGQKVLDNIINKYNYEEQEDVIQFIEDVIEHLNYDKTKDAPTPIDIHTQLKSGVETKLELYNYLFALSYLDVKYKVLFNGKDLNSNEFSPGEKGALLLIF